MVELVNSDQLSLRILLTWSLIRTSIPLIKLMSSEAVSDFSLRKKTQVNLVKSSTITRMYFLWWRLSTVDGPQRSMCRSSNGSEIDFSMITGWPFFECFPHSQAAHKWSFSNLRRDKPLTISLDTRSFIYRKFRWVSLRYHNQLTSGTFGEKAELRFANNHVDVEWVHVLVAIWLD